MKRLRFISAVLIALLMPTLSSMGAGAPGGKIKVMFLRGGGVHDWKHNTPVLKGVLEATNDFEVTFTENLDDLKERIKQFDVIAVYTTGLTLTKEQEDGLCGFVENGGGFVGIHSASDSFKNSDRYWEMTGGHFSGHRSGRYTVYIYDHEHPITKGLSDFEVEDETYRHNFHRNAQMRSLTRMSRGDERQSMAWVSDYGKGRVFYTGNGHDMKVWSNPAFQRLVVRAMYWAAKREVKDPSPSVLSPEPGFTHIFDGKTLDGWHVSRSTGHGTGGKWVVENGIIVGQQNPPGQGGILITDKKYGDFELIIEAKPEWGVDSGIFLRSTETGKGYQVLVDYHGGGNVGGIYGEGIGGFHFPSKQYPDAWKKDDWNIFRIKILGQPPQITVWMNGVHMIDYKDEEVRIPEKGGIAVQVHGGGPTEGIKEKAVYRNVQIKPL